MELSLAGSDPAIFFSELVRLETELWEAVEGRVRAEHGVPLGSYEVMSVIARQPGCRVQDIAAALSITVGGASKIVDRIEAAGLCARRANPGDRRSSIIELTEAGARLLTQLTRTVEDELSRRLGPALGDGSLAGLTGTLTRLRSAVRASAGPQEARR
ncbi:MAG TPA: MarR family transcriptional regulator [Streptosporangiaceae bacterium]|jgi:DNA-binding MarR family transcriptional regulator|nr:MarR family transcriptional regulator [Streptosporangiaceae bacterium]